MFDIKDVIKEDCEYFINLIDPGRFYHYMYLNERKTSAASGLYQLVFDGRVLWYGTLEEINAVVKSLIRLQEKRNDYELE